MRVLIEKRYVNAETCAITDPIVQEITACPILCNDCFAQLANQGAQGVFTFSAPGAPLVNGLTGTWVALSSIFPGSTTPVPGIIFGNFRWSVVPGSFPTICGYGGGFGTTLLINVAGKIDCSSDFLNSVMTAELGFGIYATTGSGESFVCSLGGYFKAFTLSCVNPFNLSLTFPVSDYDDTALGSGDITVTFLQTFP